MKKVVHELNASTAAEMSQMSRVANITLLRNDISVSFPTKPPESVLSFLREHGFKWDARRKEWRLEVPAPSEPIAPRPDDLPMSEILALLCERNSVAEERARQIVPLLTEQLITALQGRVIVFIDDKVEIYEPNL